MTIKKLNTETYMALRGQATDVLDAVKANIGNDRITDRDLDRVTMPLGGGLSWTVPTLEGEDSSKSLDGIIVHWTSPKAFWATGMESGGNTPPDCSSTDGATGHGTPGGDCQSCPLNQWGSGAGGVGKSCKEKRMLFLLRVSDLLPIVVQAPSTSIQPVRRYLLRLASQGLPYWSVVTRLGLEKASSTTGISYSRIAPRSTGPVPEEQRERLAEYVAAIRPIIGDMTATDIARDEV
tara:strand:- start:120 stop:827 length:708 start_codon:yes stop_codon:yes gene_type:complete